jgi:hypothetical protein
LHSILPRTGERNCMLQEQIATQEARDNVTRDTRYYLEGE